MIDVASVGILFYSCTTGYLHIRVSILRSRISSQGDMRWLFAMETSLSLNFNSSDQESFLWPGSVPGELWFGPFANNSILGVGQGF